MAWAAAMNAAASMPVLREIVEGAGLAEFSTRRGLCDNGFAVLPVWVVLAG